MVNHDNDYLINILVTILGIPAFVLFCKYLKLKFKYLEDRGHKFPIIEIFQPKYINDLNDEAKKIDTMLYWTVLLAFAWAIIMLILVGTFIL